MDDAQRQPRESDRKPVRDRIRRAVADGRITQADGDIRLTNVGSAQSIADLGLITRDLDQLEAILAPGSAVPIAPAPPAASRYQVTGARGTSSTAFKRTLPFLIAGALVALVAAGGLAFFATSTSSTTSTPVLADPAPLTASVTAGSDAPVDASPSAGAAYALTVPGIRSFLATYRARFGTTKVVDLTMYDDYVVVNVPVPGRDRHSGWLYRPADGFTDFGGVTANFPGSSVVDTAKLDLAALVRNIAVARRTLKVEDYSTTYVNIDYRPETDPAPNVNIYVSNKFNESGYLATELDGRIERTYAYGS